MILYFQEIWERIQYQWPLKIVSFLLAIILWVVVLGSKTIEITKEVPLEVHLGDDLILSEPLPDRITLRIAGPKAFLRSINSRLEDPIRINLENRKAGVFTQHLYSDIVKLPVGVKVLSVVPNQLTFKLEELKRKSVPVQLEFSGEVAAGLRLMKAEVSPNSVKIRGTRQRLALIQQITSSTIDLSQVKETGIIPVPLDLESLGVESDGVVPDVSLEVEGKGTVYRVRSVPVQVMSTAKATMPDTEVTVLIRADHPTHIEVEKIHAEVDVRDYPQGDYSKFIRVQLPEGLHLVRVIPNQVKVSVRKL